MKHICLAVILVALPLTAAAQEKRSDDRRSDHARSEQRKSDQNKSDQNKADRRQTDQRQPVLPWWERQQTPAWEKKQTPAWEINRAPGWENGNVARALLDQPRNPSQPQGNQSPAANRRRGRQYAPTVVYVLPAYRYFPESIPTTTQFAVTPPAPTAPIAMTPEPEPVEPMGALQLEVEPRELLQIFVDGSFVGTPADHGDLLELTPGPHRIEFRARGHRTLSFTAEILDGRSITYRGTLEPNVSAAPAPTPATPAAPQAPRSPRTPEAPPVPKPATIMYVIPGCYLGNVSPATMTLPPGCDLSKLATFKP